MYNLTVAQLCYLSFSVVVFVIKISEHFSNTGAPDTAVLKLIDSQLTYHLVSGGPLQLIDGVQRD